jgi:hypothetical protein
MDEPGFISLVPKLELGNQINRITSGLALVKELPGKCYVLGNIKIISRVTDSIGKGKARIYLNGTHIAR